MTAEQTPEWYQFEEKRPEWLQGKYGRLSDRDIRRCLEEGIIKVEPLDLSKLDEIIKNSCKIDFHFGNVVTTFKKSRLTVINLREIQSKKEFPREFQEDTHIRDGELFALHSGDFILAQTKEKLTLPDYIVATIEGKSSIARLGISVELAALFDAGWDGVGTLELRHNGLVAVELTPGDEICAFSFELLTTPAKNVYSGRYQGQTQPRI